MSSRIKSGCARASPSGRSVTKTRNPWRLSKRWTSETWRSATGWCGPRRLRTKACGREAITSIVPLRCRFVNISVTDPHLPGKSLDQDLLRQTKLVQNLPQIRHQAPGDVRVDRDREVHADPEVGAGPKLREDPRPQGGSRLPGGRCPRDGWSWSGHPTVARPGAGWGNNGPAAGLGLRLRHGAERPTSLQRAGSGLRAVPGRTADEGWARGPIIHLLCPRPAAQLGFACASTTVAGSGLRPNLHGLTFWTSQESQEREIALRFF